MTEDANGVIGEGISRRQLLRSAGVVGMALGMPSVLAACGSSGGSGAIRSSAATVATTDAAISSLSWSLDGTVRNLDYVHAYDLYTTAALAPALEGLLVLDDRGALQPRLAKSWEQSDPVTFVYQLRDDVRFWDGTPLTVDDVVFSMGQNLDPRVGSQLVSFYSSVKSIRATGPNEVTVKLKRADPIWQYVPAAHGGFIVSKAFSERAGKDLGTPGTLTMGTGPYKIESFAADESIGFVRNEDYWGEKPPLERMQLKFIVEPTTRLLAMRSKQLQGAFGVPVGQSDQWARIPGVRLQSTPGLGVDFLSFDVTADPWDDIHVRRAFAYAMDNAGLTRALLRGHGAGATSVVPPAMWGNLLPDSEIRALYDSFPVYEFDLDKARAELAKSKHPNGFSTSITYASSFALMRQILLSLSENLAQIGVTLEVKQASLDRWQAHLYAHKNLGLQAIQFLPDYPDPINYAGLLLGSEHAVPNDFNLANYKNSKADRLLAEQAAASSRAARARALGELLHLAAVDLPYLPVLWPDTVLAIDKRYAYNGFAGIYPEQPWPTKLRTAA